MTVPSTRVRLATNDVPHERQNPSPGLLIGEAVLHAHVASVREQFDHTPAGYDNQGSPVLRCPDGRDDAAQDMPREYSTERGMELRPRATGLFAAAPVCSRA